MGYNNPRKEAKSIVNDYEFRESAITIARENTGYYKNGKDMAQAMVDIYYARKDEGKSPKTIAASAIYAAHLLTNRRIKQGELHEDIGASPKAIRGVYIELAEQIQVERQK